MTTTYDISAAYPQPMTGDERYYWALILEAAHMAAHEDEVSARRELANAERFGCVPGFLPDMMLQSMPLDEWERLDMNNVDEMEKTIEKLRHRVSQLTSLIDEARDVLDWE